MVRFWTTWRPLTITSRTQLPLRFRIRVRIGSSIGPSGGAIDAGCNRPDGDRLPAEGEAVTGRDVSIAWATPCLNIDPAAEAQTDTEVTVSPPDEGVTLHNFSLGSLGISVDTEPGAAEEVVINAPVGGYED